MKNFSRKIALLTLLSGSILYGCIKEEDFDFNNLASNQWNPELAVPLIHSSLSIKDIAGVNESGMFAINNNVVSLVYNTNIFTKYGYEFFTPFTQSDARTIQLTMLDSATLFVTGTVSRSISPTIPLSFPNNEQIDSMNIRQGNLVVSLTSFVPHNAVLNITIPTATLAGQVFSKNVPVSASTGMSQNIQTSFDMSGYNIGTKKNGMPNLLDISYTLTFSKTDTALNTVNRNFDIVTTFDSMSPSSLFGYFGQREFIIPSDPAEISVFNNFQSGNIHFEDPKMTITINNSFGMPVDAQINSLSAVQGNGTIAPITGPIPSPLIGYPLWLGQTVTNSFYFDKTNSNIQTIIETAPSQILYDITAGINEPLPSYNFMSDSSVFSADLRIDLPLKGHASGFVIQDTLDISLGVMDEINSVAFRINVTNGFPVNANTQLYLADENLVILDSLFLTAQNRLIEAATIDGSGNVIAPTKRATDELFEGARLQNLFNTKKILIRSIIQTADAPNSNVEIRDDYTLDVKLGIRTKLNIAY